MRIRRASSRMCCSGHADCQHGGSLGGRRVVKCQRGWQAQPRDTLQISPQLRRTWHVNAVVSLPCHQAACLSVACGCLHPVHWHSCSLAARAEHDADTRHIGRAPRESSPALMKGSSGRSGRPSSRCTVSATSAAPAAAQSLPACGTEDGVAAGVLVRSVPDTARRTAAPAES